MERHSAIPILQFQPLARAVTAQRLGLGSSAAARGTTHACFSYCLGKQTLCRRDRRLLRATSGHSQICSHAGEYGPGMHNPMCWQRCAVRALHQKNEL